MDGKAESSETQRNKCSACFKQYNKKEHLVEHMKISYHSVHEPRCGICQKHCRYFESLREHLTGRARWVKTLVYKSGALMKFTLAVFQGTLPRMECARVFSLQGCNLCLSILDNPQDLEIHRQTCKHSRIAKGLVSQMSRLNPQHEIETYNMRTQGSQVVALGCKMVGGGNDGSLDLCGRVCVIDEDENIIFHTYVKPQIPVTNYRYDMTGITGDQLKEAMPLNQVRNKILNYLCNGETQWKIRMKRGNARILVGHGLDRDLDCLWVEYPSHLIRDTAKYPPLMKSCKLSNSLKYLTKTYLGYEIQSGIQDPYEDCVATMRLYKRMLSEAHPTQDCSEAQHRNNFATWKQKELEKMTPGALLEISRSDYYCWCLDSNQGMESS